MASSTRDYYDILGLQRTATADQIKKSYRRLARQYHPDLHTGSRKTHMEQKFKELNEAHEVLGSPDTRKKYDRYGHRWQEAEAFERARHQGQPGWTSGPESTTVEGFDFSDVLGQLFGRHSQSGAGAAFRGSARTVPDLETSIRLSLRDVVTGATRRVEVSEPVPCSTCKGTGHLRGRRCATCTGTGTRTEARTIDVKIPAGVQDGTRVRVAGKGAPGTGSGKPGDLYLRVHVVPDGVFRREGADLHAQLPVWPWEAAVGGKVLVPTLSGPVRVKVPRGSRAGGKLRLRGKGLPTTSGGRGDLFLSLQIVMPTSFGDEERRLYEQLSRFSHPDPRADLLQQTGQARTEGTGPTPSSEP